ncbi:MAG: hypothetical protein HY529_06430 [Chloroflexi bacterium]|nr:hypothetical protein [Chloroflexota bacterium]
MGYQFFQQSVEIWGPWVASHQWAGFAWAFVPIHQEQYTKEQLEALKAFQWYIKQDAPEWIDFMKGMAAGANDLGIPVTYHDVLALFARRHEIESIVPLYPGTEPAESESEELPPSEGCSGLAAWGRATRDGRVIASGSGDNMLSFRMTLMVFPETGNSYIYNPYRTMCLGGSGMPSMNDKGLCFVHHGGFGSRKIQRKQYGTPTGLYELHTLRFANNTKEAEAISDSLNPQNNQHHGFWVDVNGDAFIRESKGHIRRAGDFGEEDFLHATNNGLLPDSHSDGEAYYEHGGWGDPDPAKPGHAVSRNLRMWEMLHNYHGHVDLEFTKMMWRYPSDDPVNPTISHLSSPGVAIALPDKLLWYSASRCPARKPTPGAFNCDNYTVNPIHSFYQLRLGDNPDEVAQAAHDHAKKKLYSADHELRKLNWADVAYAPLDSMFNQAVTDWFVGEHYLYLGSRTTDNESLYNYAKSIRAFTRCQAEALEIYESLVLPPTSPDDLGLKQAGKTNDANQNMIRKERK